MVLEAVGKRPLVSGIHQNLRSVEHSLIRKTDNNNLPSGEVYPNTAATREIIKNIQWHTNTWLTLQQFNRLFKVKKPGHMAERRE